MKRRTILYGAAGLFLVVALVLVLVPPERSEPTVKIMAFFHLYNEPVRDHLEVILEDFRGFYPEVELEYRIEPYKDMKRSLVESLNDRSSLTEDSETWGIVSVLSAGDEALVPAEVETPSNWISSSWRLYYSKKRLEDLGYDQRSVSVLSASGLEEFTEVLSAETRDGETLFVTGTMFRLPWIAWVQHLEILARNGEMPEGAALEDWARGMDAFEVLAAGGLINPDHRQLNQAGSQLGILEGRGLFVLSDESIYSTYSPADRGRLQSIPFPGSENQGWRIGSGVILGGFTSSETDPRVAEAEDLLLDYLHSEGVSERFLRETGIRLLPRRTSRFAVKDLPSLTGFVGDAEYRDLLTALDDK